MPLILDTTQAAFLTAIDAYMDQAFAEGTVMPGGTPPVLPQFEGWEKLKQEFQDITKNAFKSQLAALIKGFKDNGGLGLFNLNDIGTPTYFNVQPGEFANGFGIWGDGNYSTGQVRYWKDGLGIVHVTGLVRTPASSGHAYQTMFTLPVGFRPASLDAQIISCVHNDAHASVQVGYDGTVVIRQEPVPDGWISMNLHFKAG